MTSATALTIRVATPADADALRHLAGLDSAAPLTGTVLLAESDGVVVAALSSADGRAIADPFRPTAHVAALLRIQAAAGRDVPTRGSARSLARSLPARLRPV